MALPLIPIILAVASLGAGIVQGISAKNNADAQIEALQSETRDRINERAKSARKLMSQQKTSFLKGGVYFNTGTPLAVINETYDTMGEDINAMIKDANTKQSNLERQGKTAFLSSVLEGVANGAMSFLGTSALAKGAGSLNLGNIGKTISNSKVGTAFTNWYNSARGLSKGGFGSLPTSGLPSASGNKIT